MRNAIVLGLFALALTVVGCASTATTEAPVAAPEATAEAAPAAEADSCCAKAKAAD